MLVVIKDVIFPVMCFSDADASLWEDDPYDFIRVKYGRWPGWVQRPGGLSGRPCSVGGRGR